MSFNEDSRDKKESPDADSIPVVTENESTLGETTPAIALMETVSPENKTFIAETEPTLDETTPAIAVIEAVSAENKPVLSKNNPTIAITESVNAETKSTVDDKIPAFALTEPFDAENRQVLAEHNPAIALNVPVIICDEPVGDVNKLVCIYEEEYKRYVSARNDLLIEKAKEIQEKMIIAKNIIQVCKHEQRTPDGTVALMKLHRITNLQYDYLARLTKDSSEAQTRKVIDLTDGLESRSMIKAIRETKPIPKNVLPYIYGDIRDLFVEQYVEKKQIPSRNYFLSHLRIKRHNIYYRDNMYYIDMTIRTLVKNNLLEYHHFPKINRYIITEHPEFMYKRNIYLNQIMRHRKEQKPIVYVAVKRIENITDRCASFLLLAASSTVGLISKHEAIERADEDVPNEETKLWLQSRVLPKLVSGSVVVLTQPRVINTIPTPDSKTYLIKEWLQRHDIPFDDSDHKAGLYSLVNIFKKRCKDKGFYEDIISSNGFEVMICPPEYENLDFFIDIYDYMRKSLSSTKAIFLKVFRMINKLTDVEWVQMENKMIEVEKRMLEEDNEMDRIVENILHMAKNDDARAADFPVACIGTKAENFMIHIGNVIVD